MKITVTRRSDGGLRRTIARLRALARQRRPWTPINPDGSVNDAELRRPAETAEPTTWEVRLFADAIHRWDREHHAAIFGVAAFEQRHAFRVVLVDMGRAIAWFAGPYQTEDRVMWCANEACYKLPESVRRGIRLRLCREWPLPNVTLVSPTITTQAEADRVLPELLGVRAARREAVFAPVRPIDLFRVNDPGRDTDNDYCRYTDALQGFTYQGSYHKVDSTAYEHHAKLDAVRVRGGATPMHPKWVRLLKDQAKNAGVPFSLAWGEWAPVAMPHAWFDGLRAVVHVSGEARLGASWADVVAAQGDWHGFERWGSARSGCTLDGVAHPEEV